MFAMPVCVGLNMDMMFSYAPSQDRCGLGSEIFENGDSPVGARFNKEKNEKLKRQIHYHRV